MSPTSLNFYHIAETVISRLMSMAALVAPLVMAVAARSARFPQVSVREVVVRFAETEESEPTDAFCHSLLGQLDLSAEVVIGCRRA
jgi:hypothetical protein